MEREIFVNQLLKWYRYQGRELPWRETNDPYKIWLSEIILQQTRIVQGLPYYLRFIEAYPTINDLAKADEQEVLRLWQGLGYYSRARNLHACAKQVINEFEGKFPEEYGQLLKLKGIGPYTAAAIASLAFKKQEAVVDGNVYRVLSRVFGLENDIADSSSHKVFKEFAEGLITKVLAADFNQAIMDFGAIQCKPKNPSCGICPMSSFCIAYNSNRQEELPMKTKKVKVRKRHFTYLIISFGDKVLMKKREGKDIWQGLYDFPLQESKNLIDTQEVLSKYSFGNGVHIQSESMEFKHILTHQQIFARFIEIKAEEPHTFEKLKQEIGAESFLPQEVEALPKPILIEKYLKRDLN